MVSRESSFLFNNLVLLAACFAVLWGTLFPVFSEWFTGSKISVGPPFFNKVNIPIALFLLLLTGIGPLLAWRKTSFDALKRNFAWPLAGGIAAAWLRCAFGFRDFYALICLILCVFVTLTILSEFYRGARVISQRDGTNLLTAAGELTMRNTRRYGGYVVHFGDGPDLHRDLRGRRLIRTSRSKWLPGDTLTHRAVHARLPEFRRDAERQLHFAAGDARSVSQREIRDDAVSRAAILFGEPSDGNDGGGRELTAARFVRRVRGAESGHESAGDSRLHQSAGEMDMVRRDCGRAGDGAGDVAEPEDGDCAAAGDGAGVGRERVAGGGRCGDGADSAGGFA